MLNHAALDDMEVIAVAPEIWFLWDSMRATVPLVLGPGENRPLLLSIKLLI